MKPTTIEMLAVLCDLPIGSRTCPAAEAIRSLISRSPAVEALADAARAVISDHQERIALYPGSENQPKRIKVISELDAALALYDVAAKEAKCK